MTKQEQYDLRNEPNGILTTDELRVLNEMKDGSSAKVAGNNLGMGKRTAEKHAEHFKEKLHAVNTANAVSIGYQTGILIVTKKEEE